MTRHECVGGIVVVFQPDGSVRLTIDEATVTLNRGLAVELANHIRNSASDRTRADGAAAATAPSVSEYRCLYCEATWEFDSDNEPSAREQFDAHRRTLKHYDTDRHPESAVPAEPRERNRLVVDADERGGLNRG